MCEKESQRGRERERTLCRSWTQKPDARANPSLSPSIWENRGWAVLSVFPSGSALTVMNEGCLAKSPPSIYADKYPQYTNTPCAGHTSHRFTWPCLWFISQQPLQWNREMWWCRCASKWTLMYEKPHKGIIETHTHTKKEILPSTFYTGCSVYC